MNKLTLEEKKYILTLEREYMYLESECLEKSIDTEEEEEYLKRMNDIQDEIAKICSNARKRV